MRKVVLSAVVFLAVMLLAAAPSRAEGVRIYESSHDDQISEGDTQLAAEPETVYAAASDFARWTAIFPDIRKVIVTRQNGVDALVTFVYADGHRDNLHFHNRPYMRTVWFEDTGGRATVWAEISFASGDRAGTTHVHTRIYADVKGVAGWFVSDSRVRNLRQKRIMDDLTHLRSYFASQASVASAP